MAITECLDVATRMPLGFLITFEAPSVYRALTTLKRAIRPKRSMKKMYPQITREWDGVGPPVELLMDNTWEHQAPSLKQSRRNVGRDLHWGDPEGFERDTRELLTQAYRALGREPLAAIVDVHHAHRELRSVDLYE